MFTRLGVLSPDGSSKVFDRDGKYIRYFCSYFSESGLKIVFHIKVRKQIEDVWGDGHAESIWT